MDGGPGGKAPHPPQSVCLKEGDALRREARPHWLLWAESGATFSHLWPMSSHAHIPSRIGECSFLRPGNGSPTDLGDKVATPRSPVSSMVVHPLQLTQEDPEKLVWSPHQQGSSYSLSSSSSSASLSSACLSSEGDHSECDSEALGRGWAVGIATRLCWISFPGPRASCVWRGSSRVDAHSTALSPCPQPAQGEAGDLPLPQDGAQQPGDLPGVIGWQVPKGLHGHWLPGNPASPAPTPWSFSHLARDGRCWTGIT